MASQLIRVARVPVDEAVAQTKSPSGSVAKHGEYESCSESSVREPISSGRTLSAAHVVVRRLLPICYLRWLCRLW